MVRRYIVLLAVNSALSAGLLRLVVAGAGVPSWLAHPTLDIILIGLAFVASRRWIFLGARS